MERQVTVTRDTERRVYSFSDKSQKINTWGSRDNLDAKVLNPYCQTDTLPEIRLLKLPSHGETRFSIGKTQPPQCPNLIEGIVVFYKPAAGFVGRDQFIVQRKGDYRSNGLDREFTFVVTVQ